MILEDLTTAICNASDELKVGCNSSIASLRFSLLDSMSAVELLDHKMDQCCGLFGKLNNKKYFDNLFSEAFDSSLDVRKTVAVLLFNFENEVAFLSGDSLMESSHTSIFVWNQTWNIPIAKDSFTNRCVLLSAQSLTLSLDSIFSAVLAADIYEDEDFSPGFRSHLNSNSISSHQVAEDIDALICTFDTVQLMPDEKDVIVSLLTLRNLTTKLFAAFNHVVTTCITAATSRLRSRSNGAEKIEIDEILSMDSLNCFKHACENSLRCVNELLAKSVILEGFISEVIRSELVSSVSNLYLSGPKRKSSRVGFTESLHVLSSIITGFVDVVNVLLPLLNGNEKYDFEDILLMLCDRSSKCEHLLVRSLLCSLLHCVGVNMNKFLSFKRLLSDNLASNDLVLEWIGGNLTLSAWETIKLLCSNRRKIFARLTSLLSNWGVISSEALYVDEQLKNLSNNPQSFPQICTSWTTLIVTRLMDLYMKLVCESSILESSELGYFYWYWDYILSVNAHARDKLRMAEGTNKVITLSKYDELLCKAEGLLARSSFRLFLYIHKNGGLSRPVLKYTQAATIYSERFKAFHNIPNPTPLSYMDYLHSTNSLSEDRVDPQQLLSSISICLENAKKLLLDARNVASQCKRVVNADVVKLIKFVFSFIISTKKLQELAAQSKPLKKIHFEFSENEYFPKLQYECE